MTHVWEFESPPGWRTAVFKEFEGQVKCVAVMHVCVFASYVGAFRDNDCVGDGMRYVASEVW